MSSVEQMREGGRGRAANSVRSQFIIQGFYVPFCSPPRHTHKGFQVSQLRAVRLLAAIRLQLHLLWIWEG